MSIVQFKTNNNVISFNSKNYTVIDSECIPKINNRNRTTTNDGRPVPRAATALNDEEVESIAKYFLSSNHKYKYRNYLIFMLGINTGRRMGDMISIRIGDILNKNGEINRYFTIREGKTQRLYDMELNDYVVNALKLYLNTLPKSVLENRNNFLFYSRKKQVSKVYKSKKNKDGTLLINPYFGCNVLRVDSVYSIFNEASRALGIKDKTHFSTHSLRKTYGEKLLHTHPEPSEALALLQDDYGHARSSTTLKYLGGLKSKRKVAVNNFKWKVGD